MSTKDTKQINIRELDNDSFLLVKEFLIDYMLSSQPLQPLDAMAQLPHTRLNEELWLEYEKALRMFNMAFWKDRLIHVIDQDTLSLFLKLANLNGQFFKDMQKYLEERKL